MSGRLSLRSSVLLLRSYGVIWLVVKAQTSVGFRSDRVPQIEGPDAITRTSQQTRGCHSFIMFPTWIKLYRLGLSQPKIT